MFEFIKKDKEIKKMFPVSKMSFCLLGSLDDIRSQALKLSYQLAVRFMYFMWFVKMGELA